LPTDVVNRTSTSPAVARFRAEIIFAASVGCLGLAAGTSARRVDLTAGLTLAWGRCSVLTGGFGSARAIVGGGNARFRGGLGDGTGSAVLRLGGVLPLNDFAGEVRLGALASVPLTAGRAFVGFGGLAAAFWGCTAFGFGGGAAAFLALCVLCGGTGSFRLCVCLRSGALGAGVYVAFVPPRCPPASGERSAQALRRSGVGGAVERGL